MRIKANDSIINIHCNYFTFFTKMYNLFSWRLPFSSLLILYSMFWWRVFLYFVIFFSTRNNGLTSNAAVNFKQISLVAWLVHTTPSDISTSNYMFFECTAHDHESLEQFGEIAIILTIFSWCIFDKSNENILHGYSQYLYNQICHRKFGFCLYKVILCARTLSINIFFLWFIDSPEVAFVSYSRFHKAITLHQIFTRMRCLHNFHSTNFF